MARLAFLGTGLMGEALAYAALGRHEEVVVWNRTTSRTHALGEAGAQICATPAEAVRGADRVHMAFPDDVVVGRVLEMCRGALEADAVIVDHTTGSPEGTAACSVRLAASGVAYVHAPVFMSPAMCREATGLMLVAGPKAAYEKVAEGLGQMAGQVKYLGEDVKRSAAFKLFGNAMKVALVAGMADVFAMAASLGIDPLDAHGLFEDFSPLGEVTHRGATMARGEYSPTVALSLVRKDVRLMLEAAGAQQLTVLPGIAERMDALIAAGYGAADLGVLSMHAVPQREA